MCGGGRRPPSSFPSIVIEPGEWKMVYSIWPITGVRDRKEPRAGWGGVEGEGGADAWRGEVRGDSRLCRDDRPPALTKRHSPQVCRHRPPPRRRPHRPAPPPPARLAAPAAAQARPVGRCNRRRSVRDQLHGLRRADRTRRADNASEEGRNQLPCRPGAVRADAAARAGSVGGEHGPVRDGPRPRGAPKSPSLSSPSRTLPPAPAYLSRSLSIRTDSSPPMVPVSIWPLPAHHSKARGCYLLSANRIAPKLFHLGGEHWAFRDGLSLEMRDLGATVTPPLPFLPSTVCNR